MESECRLVVSWDSRKENGKKLLSGQGVLSWNDRNVLELNRGDGCTALGMY